MHSFFFESLLFCIFGKMALAGCQKKSDCLSPRLLASHICLLPAAIKKVKWRGRRRSAVRTCIIFLPFARPTQFSGWNFLLILAKSDFCQAQPIFWMEFFCSFLQNLIFFTQTHSLAMLSQICYKQ